jgi:long-chain acyl-CoA synthetase
VSSGFITSAGDRVAPEPPVARIDQLLARASEELGDEPFLGRWSPDGWSWIGFEEAHERANAFAAALRKAGLNAGDRVALMGENRPEWGLAYLATLAAGGVCVPLDTQLQEVDAGEILESSGARFLVASSAHRPRLERALSMRDRPATMFALEDLGAPRPSEASSTKIGRLDERVSSDAESATRTDLAALLFTSGTTGKPKGVMLTHANVLSNIEAIEDAFQFRPGDRFLSVLPLHHAFECTVGLLGSLRIGASVAYARSLKSNELREDLASARASILLGVPLLYEKLLAGLERGLAAAPFWLRSLLHVAWRIRRATGMHAETLLMSEARRQAGLGSLRMVVSGAAPLPPHVWDGLTDLGFLVLEGYGLTECSPVVCANRPERAESGTVGQALPGIELRIDDPDENGEGEILVRGPNVTPGYWRNPEITREVLGDGWFHTGDLGRIRADEKLVITGRLKNLIVTAAGKKVYPEEIEVRIAASRFVREVAVVSGHGVQGDREEVHAHIVPELDELKSLATTEHAAMDVSFVSEVLENEVEKLGRDLALFKRVRKVIIRTDPLPRTSTGKVKRDALQ